MATSAQLIDAMQSNPADVRFADLKRLCELHFGKPRQSASSHLVFKTPWIGDPRINIQNDRGRAKPYQVRQVLAAVAKLKEMKHAK